MANNKDVRKKPAHSGFEAEIPYRNKPYPKGTTFRKNADGTVTPVQPRRMPAKKK